MKEKILSKTQNGLPMMLLWGLLYIIAIAVIIIGGVSHMENLAGIGTIWVCIGWFPFKGLIVLKPQEALVLTLFGKYHGTLKGDGFYWVNPF